MRFAPQVAARYLTKKRFWTAMKKDVLQLSPESIVASFADFPIKFPEAAKLAQAPRKPVLALTIEVSATVAKAGRHRVNASRHVLPAKDAIDGWRSKYGPPILWAWAGFPPIL
jgi:hypothetical protein